MSDNIPFEIQVEIIKKLPFISVVQFRSVSKAWKSLVDGADFIAAYRGQQQRLLVLYNDLLHFKKNYVSCVDDDTFPHQGVSVTVPLLDKPLKHSKPIGSSHGLLCLYGDYMDRAVIWNPSIRKAVVVDVPDVENGMHVTDLGFGVCRETADPKIVKVTYADELIDIMQVEVYTLSTRVWRSPYSTLPRKSISFVSSDYSRVVVDGVLYWLAKDMIITDGETSSYNLIVSFDMTSEEFKEVNLPHCVAQTCHSLYIFELRKSLVVVESYGDSMYPDIRVWMMEDDVSKSFTKLLFIHAPCESLIYVRGFRNTGEPIIEIIRFYLGLHGSLAVYEPRSESIDDLGICKRDVSYFVYSYVETLLLLDQPVFTNREKGDDCIAKWGAKNKRLLKRTSKV